MPSLGNYLSEFKNGIKLAPEEKTELKKQFHEDLLKLKAHLNSEKDFAGIEEGFGDLIDNPKVLIGICNEIVGK